MDSSDSQQRRSPRTGIYLFLVLVALGVVLAWSHVGRDGPDTSEAVIRSGVGRDLIQGLTRGRQGLVGSLRWAPLPTLLVLPLLHTPGIRTGTFGLCVTATIGAAGICVFLNRWWAQYGMREEVRVPIAFALFLTPPMLKPIFEGSSETMFAFLVIATAAHLIHWWETEELRSLAYTAVCAALASLVRYQAVLLPILVIVLLLGHLIARHKREAYAEGTLITFLVPSVYAFGLWYAANWLIMGDATFFLRGLDYYLGSPRWWRFLWEGCEWQACLAPGLLGLLGWSLCRLAGRKLSIWTGVPVLAACGLLWLQGTTSLEPTPAGPATRELRQTVLPYLNMSHRSDKVITSGYRGYEIHRHTGEVPMFLHKQSLYLDQALEETRGKSLYLLVPAPEGIDRWEDVNLKYPGIFRNGARGVVFEKAWKYWTLWRVVRLDTQDQVI